MADDKKSRNDFRGSRVCRFPGSARTDAGAAEGVRYRENGSDSYKDKVNIISMRSGRIYRKLEGFCLLGFTSAGQLLLENNDYRMYAPHDEVVLAGFPSDSLPDDLLRIRPVDFRRSEKVFWLPIDRDRAVYMGFSDLYTIDLRKGSILHTFKGKGQYHPYFAGFEAAPEPLAARARFGKDLKKCGVSRIQILGETVRKHSRRNRPDNKALQNFSPALKALEEYLLAHAGDDIYSEYSVKVTPAEYSLDGKNLLVDTEVIQDRDSPAQPIDY